MPLFIYISQHFRFHTPPFSLQIITPFSEIYFHFLRYFSELIFDYAMTTPLHCSRFRAYFSCFTPLFFDISFRQLPLRMLFAISRHIAVYHARHYFHY